MYFNLIKYYEYIEKKLTKIKDNSKIMHIVQDIDTFNTLQTSNLLNENVNIQNITQNELILQIYNKYVNNKYIIHYHYYNFRN